MTTFQLWLIFGVPFFLTGLFYIAVSRSGGRRSILSLIAMSYVILVVLGPIWLCTYYFSSKEIWYGIAVNLSFRALELLVFKVGEGFIEAWKKGSEGI